MKHIRTIVLAAAILSAGAMLAAPHSVKIVNASKWNIDKIFISHVSEKEWGSDLLGTNEVLKPGESVDITADCGSYDVKLIDQDGVECVEEGVDICSGSETWTVGDLTTCK